jgi:hypothetical protein
MNVSTRIIIEALNILIFTWAPKLVLYVGTFLKQNNNHALEMHEVIFLFKRYMIIVMIWIKTTWIIIKYLKCLTYCSWYNYAHIFFKHRNFMNVSTSRIVETKLAICFCFDVSRMLKLCHLLICPYSFCWHYLDYGSYSIWWSNHYCVIIQD